MALSAITESAVHDALNAIRYDRSLQPSGLLGLDLVGLKLAEAGMEDSAPARSWALSESMTAMVEERLAASREPMSTVEMGSKHRGSGNFWQMLRALLASGDAEAMAWGLLYCRYLWAERRTMCSIADDLGIPQRTLSYRLARGRASLTDALRAAEAEAGGAAAASACQDDAQGLQLDLRGRPEIARRLLTLAGVALPSPGPAAPSSVFDRPCLELSVIVDLDELERTEARSLRAGPSPKTGRLADQSIPGQNA